LSDVQRRLSFALVLTATALGGAVLAGPIGATTGVSTGLPQPEVLVLRQDGVPFEGRFVLTSIDRGARITGGQISAEFTETTTPYLVGFAEYGTFDDDGRQTFLTANLYPWSYDKAKRTITAQIISQGANEKLGSLALKLPSNPEHLDGALTLNGRPYAVTYRRVDEDLNLYGKLPKVQLTTPSVHLTDQGWGPQAAYLGRYRLATATTASANATMYAPLVELAHRLSEGPTAALDASLTLQARGAAGPGGVLSLHEPGSSAVAYLTDLRSGGDARAGVLRRGGFDGPVIGRFTATADEDRLTGTVTLHGHRTPVDLERYSAP
jgi:hypothetical protein